MNPLKQNLIEILQLKDFKEEVNKKLVGTFMEVNGKLIKIKAFYFDEGVILGEIVWEKQETVTINTPGKQITSLIPVETLSVWFPESGLYPLKDGRLLMVERIPKRVWHKSYHEECFTFNLLGRKTTDQPSNMYGELFNGRASNIRVCGGGNVYFHKNIIGCCSDKGIICLDETYFQELLDWSRDETK